MLVNRPRINVVVSAFRRFKGAAVRLLLLAALVAGSLAWSGCSFMKERDEATLVADSFFIAFSKGDSLAMLSFMSKAYPPADGWDKFLSDLQRIRQLCGAVDSSSVATWQVSSSTSGYKSAHLSLNVYFASGRRAVTLDLVKARDRYDIANLQVDMTGLPRPRDFPQRESSK